MIIQLQIESLLKQIQKDIKRNAKNQHQTMNKSTDTSESDDDNKSTASSLLERTKYHISTGQEYVIPVVQVFDKQVNKITQICSQTFTSDKIVRIIGSVIKIFRVFNMVKDTKPLQKVAFQIIQLRRLLRCNRILSYLRECKQLLEKKDKIWLDYYNIIFKNLQFVLDINDSISYLQQLNLISSKRFNNQSLKKNTSNLYFIECLMFLFLNSYDYLKNRHHRTRKQNLRKQLNISKYALDTITSHNQFSRRLYTCDVKANTIIGAVSSFVGLLILWV